jgi:hypothetical protein
MGWIRAGTNAMNVRHISSVAVAAFSAAAAVFQAMAAQREAATITPPMTA